MMYIQCKTCGASLDGVSYVENMTPDGKHFIVKILPGHVCPAEQNVQRNGLTPSQKEEVSQMIMSALATGSV